MSDVSDIVNLIRDLDLSKYTTPRQQTNRGGYSDIYQGDLYEGEVQTKVAIKALRVQGSRDTSSAPTEERLYKRFYREVLLWRRLQHPNIVPLLGYIILRDDGSPALISPWYPNGNITKYLELHPDIDRSSLTLDVIRGLEYLHSIPVAHGDLKGENVLVDANGHASLCDFGMSQFVEEATRITGFTTTNAYLGGTDRFMCPELLDERPKTTATDIWALGCLIVQILTDEIPYQRISRKQAVMMAISRGEQPMLNLNGAIEKSSWEIIKKCWSSDPARRPSAIDMKSHFDPDDNPEGPPSLSDLVCSNFLSDSHHSVPYIEFSPGGGLLAVARSNGDVKIFEVGKNTLNLIRTWKCLNWVASLFIWRVAWSITERHIFIVSHQFTRIYVVETGELVKDLGLTRTAAFVFNSPNIAFVPRSSGDMAQSTITFQHFTGIGAERLRLTSCPKNIIDVGFIDNERVVLASPGILYIYNFKSEKTETRTPVKEGLQMLSTSRDGSFVLMVYDAEHPEVWKVSVANRKYRANQIQLSYLHQYRSPKGDERFRGRYTKVQFGGLDDQMIIGLWIFQKLYIWNRDTSALVHSIPLTQSGCIWDMSFRWNSVNPKDIMLVVASWAGYQIWSVSDPGSIETTGPESDLNDTTETTRDDEEHYSLAESVDPGESQPSAVETNQTIQHSSQQHPRPYIYLVPPPPSITVNGHLYTTPHL